MKQAEIYVFDSSLLSSPSPNAPKKPASHIAEPDPYEPGNPPDTLASQTDLQSWQALFKDRRSWATNLRENCAGLADQAQQYTEEQAIIERSLNVAVYSLQVHTKSAEQKYAAAEAWADESLREQEAHMDNWEADLERLAQIPANGEFAKFIQGQNASSRRSSASTTLQSFVDLAQVRKAAGSAQDIMTSFAQRVVDLRSSLEATGKQSDDLLNAVEQMQTRSSVAGSEEPPRLMEEIDIILKKMNSDFEHVNSLPKNAQSVSQASKMALLHTRNYLPNLSEYCAEMNDLLARTVDKRNSTAETAMQHMQTLASVESRLSKAYADIKALEVPQDEQQAFNTLNIVSRLPYVYGSLLVEAVRRREWVEKMKKDASTLAEEVATYKEEEERRRKKWFNSIDDVIKPEVLKSKALGMDVNLKAEEDEWPAVTRQDVQDYLDMLSDAEIPQQVLQDLERSLRSLNQPTKKQVKHAKAFKNGSMHEAAFGSTSLMLRGEDEYKVLRDATIKLEEELRGQKSRVRKLEDLLHRQTHMSRVSTGDVFRPQMELMSEPQTPNFPTPRQSEEFLRQESLKSRRRSSNLASEEKKLAKRVVSLEADLQAAKDYCATLEKEVQGREQVDADGKRQIEEANSTKKDIMENMEAQQREFTEERRNLEQELGQARSKIEEIEDEMDRLLGSRDNVDARTKALEAELEKVKSGAVRDLKRMSEELQAAMDAKAEAEQAMSTMREVVEEERKAQLEQAAMLTAAHTHLSPGNEPPEKFTSLASALEDLARRSAAHVRELSEAVAIAKSENDSLRSQQESQAESLAKQVAKQSELEDQFAQLCEEASSEKAKASSLAVQLDEDREQLRMLRSKFADGETDADVLRQRVTEEEAKVGELSEQLAETKSHANALDVELMRVQNKLNTAQIAAKAASERLNARSTRSKEISQRLYAQNARLLRLLESLGFAVTHQDSRMVIERASKVAASTTLTDPAGGVSLSSPPPTRKPSYTSEDPAGLAFLHWSDSATATDEESQYASFIQHISFFSTETFSEAIAKRLRDFEYTARKWQKEARSYKEKSHRFQAEAHAKIAVRDFKEGDLALFLPTKGKHQGAWAAFNINAPHHFLREREGMALGRREWLVARISKVEERIVNYSKDMSAAASAASDGRSIGDASSAAVSFDDNENPFDLSDGLTWYLVHAAEEKAGAPTTPGLGKSTVAAANVDARGSIRGKKKGDDASRTLNKSLDSRRSSSGSKKSVAGAMVPTLAGASAGASPVVGSLEDRTPVGLGGRGRSDEHAAATVTGNMGAGLGIIDEPTPTPPPPRQQQQQQQSQGQDQVRKDLLWGP